MQVNSSSGRIEMRIYKSKPYQKNDFPDWVNIFLRAREGYLIIWNVETKTVIEMWAKMAIQFLAKMQADYSWREEGIIIGEPNEWIVYKNELDFNNLRNQLQLNRDQARELFEFLEKHVTLFQEAAKREENEAAKALASVYKSLLEVAKEKRSK